MDIKSNVSSVISTGSASNVISAGSVTTSDFSITLSPGTVVVSDTPVLAQIKNKIHSREVQNKNFPQEMPDSTKTYLRGDGKHLSVGKYKDGHLQGVEKLIPEIRDVKVVDDQAVYVFFEDGTKERAVRSAYDTFTLEQGISICLAKKLIATICKSESGSSVYNKLIEHCLKVYQNNREEERQQEQEENTLKERKKKAKEKASRRKERIRQKETERQIEIQKEAYVRAMREIGGK